MAKKGGGSQTVTQTLDPATQAMQRQVYGAAQAAAAQPVPGVDPLTQQAAGGFQSLANLGLTGAAALGGDAGAVGQMMNPYQQQVVDAFKTQLGDVRAGTMQQVNDAATRAGAFGGSRHGVALGQALGDVDKAAAGQIAGLLQSGFADTMSRAGLAANLGLGANAQLAQLGDYSRGVALSQDPTTHRFEVLRSALQGVPYGTSTTQPVNQNRAAGALGGAATGAQIGGAFGPLGTGIGAGIGGLIGLFG